MTVGNDWESLCREWSSGQAKLFGAAADTPRLESQVPKCPCLLRRNITIRTRREGGGGERAENTRLGYPLPYGVAAADRLEDQRNAANPQQFEPIGR